MHPRNTRALRVLPKSTASFVAARIDRCAYTPSTLCCTIAWHPAHRRREIDPKESLMSPRGRGPRTDYRCSCCCGSVLVWQVLSVPTYCSWRHRRPSEGERPLGTAIVARDVVVGCARRGQSRPTVGVHQEFLNPSQKELNISLDTIL